MLTTVGRDKYSLQVNTFQKASFVYHSRKYFLILLLYFYFSHQTADILATKKNPNNQQTGIIGF